MPISPEAPFVDRPDAGLVVTIDESSWKREVEQSGKPVLVYFWAPWGIACSRFLRIVEGIAAERAGQIKVVQVNVDANKALAARFGIGSIPTLHLVRGLSDGGRLIGAATRQSVEDWLDDCDTSALSPA